MRNMETALFSVDPAERYEASVSSPAVGRAQNDWPRGCRGALNGWLMLVGPSPGRQDSDSDIWAGGPGRPYDETARIGPDAGVIAYDTNRGRNKRWNMFSEAIFDNLEYAQALTTLTNLDWGHHADNRTIPEAHLREGCQVIAELMQRTKPRIVVTLVRRTWDILMPYLRRRFTTLGYVPATGLDSLVFRLPGFDAPTIAVRSPQHPSRHFFTEQHAQLVRDEVQAFLATDFSINTGPTEADAGGKGGHKKASERGHTQQPRTEASEPESRSGTQRHKTRVAPANWRDRRPSVVSILEDHGYVQFSQDHSVVRCKGAGTCGERIAVHPEEGELTLYVRRGGASYLQAIADELGIELAGAVLPVRGLDLDSLDRKLGEVKALLRKYPK